MESALKEAGEKIRKALQNYADCINEDNCHPCDHEAGGLWIDSQSSLVQELQAEAEEALEAWDKASAADDSHREGVAIGP